MSKLKQDLEQLWERVDQAIYHSIEKLDYFYDTYGDEIESGGDLDLLIRRRYQWLAEFLAHTKLGDTLNVINNNRLPDIRRNLSKVEPKSQRDILLVVSPQVRITSIREKNS